MARSEGSAIGLKAFALSLTGVAAAAFLLGRALTRRPPTPSAWQLVIWKKFKSVEDRDQFMALFGPLAAYVSEKEPGALAYDMSVADNEPTKVLIFERYVSKQYYLEVHRTSKVFKEATADFEFESGGGQSYIESNLGRF